jgi:ribonuclease G
VRDLGKLFEDKSIKRANVQVFHNLSGVLTPEVQKKLTKTFKRTLSFTFTWPIPASFEIKGSKKNGQE